MSDGWKMTRRHCLTVLLSTAAAIGWPKRWSSAGTAGRHAAEAARWRTQLRAPQSAVVVGSAYLATVPQTERELVDDLAVAVGRPRGGVLELSDADLASRLRARVRSDYGEQRTVRLHGWTLSRTEAQLCAIYALGEATA